MKRIKITAFVDIENVFVYVDDGATDEEIDNEVAFYVNERLDVGWSIASNGRAST